MKSLHQFDTNAVPPLLLAWKHFQRRLELLTPILGAGVISCSYTWGQRSRWHKILSYLEKAVVSIREVNLVEVITVANLMAKNVARIFEFVGLCSHSQVVLKAEGINARQIIKCQKIVFIAWTTSSINWIGSKRAYHLSNYLNCKLFTPNSFIKQRGRYWKIFFGIDYLYKSAKTFVFLLKYRPDICIAQSGPSFCPMVTHIYTFLFKKKLIVDSHNGSFYNPWIKVPFYKSVLKKSDAVVVHNEEFKNYLTKLFPDVSFYVLPDKLPNYPNNKMKITNKYILISTSHSDDEPLEEILKGIDFFLREHTDTDIKFKISGDFNKNFALYSKYKQRESVEFIGHVDDDQYINELTNAFGLICLSRRQMIQQCAVIESIAAGIPFIVSESATAIRLFSKGCEMTKNDKYSISKAIDTFIANQNRLSFEVLELKKEMDKEWGQLFNRLISEKILMHS